MALGPGPQGFTMGGDIPEGLKGTIIGDLWKSGVTNFRTKVSYEMLPSGMWQLLIFMYRIDGKERKYKFPVPRTADELFEAYKRAALAMRQEIPVGQGPVSQADPQPKDFSQDSDALAGHVIAEEAKRLKRPQPPTPLPPG